MNEIVKTLTVVTSIFMPLMLVTGIYGMNFKNMPEIQSPLGYPIAIGVMVVLTLVMLGYLKRKKWL